MSRIYDNWERLVEATLKREQLWQLFHAHSRTPSISSIASDFSFSSSIPDLPFEFPSSSSWYQQNSVFENGVFGWGYNANDLKVKQKSDRVEKLAPGDIFVNRRPLSLRELTLLLSCPYPPKKLKRGNYWYDKYSGFWGKQGYKPSEIISANLDIGGYLETRASNGSTLVYINGREITKIEVPMLKLAGVKCYPDTHLWMNDDGYYQEEAGQPIRGSIWSKAGMKLLCSLLSLPFPPKSHYISGGVYVPEDIEPRPLQKLLLIGCSGSGTSTIFKQAIFLYGKISFFNDELEEIKLLIQSNIYHYIRVLLEGHKRFEEESLKESRKNQSANECGLTGSADASDEKNTYSFGPRLRAFSDWIIQCMESGSFGIFSAAFIQASAPLVEELWRNAAFQETFRRKSELQELPNVANYFLERVVQIFKQDYEPSQMDILYAEGFPPSLSYMDFSFPPPRHDEVDSWDQQDFLTRYRLIRSTSNGFGDNWTSFEVFEDVRIVIFCVSLSDYDQFIIDDNGASFNKMIYHRQCFESMVKNPIFDEMVFLLLLTKFDLFEEKVEQIPLDQCDWFNDFRPVKLYNGVVYSLGEKGFHYISVKFKRLYTALTGRKLYAAKVKCLDWESIDSALGYAKEILKWEEEMNEYSYTDYSSEYSEDS